MRAEILVGRERRRRWSTNDKLQVVREAFAPGARVALVARRRDVSRSQIYQWRAALREGQLSDKGGEVSRIRFSTAKSMISETRAPVL